MDEEKALQTIQRGHLAARVHAEVEDILDAEERRVIQGVMVKLNAGETLDPQFAVQQWLALHSSRSFRRTLLQRERQVASAGKRMANNLTNTR